jgi:hypothetical protein
VGDRVEVERLIEVGLEDAEDDAGSLSSGEQRLFDS